ncbi:hypothetical protein F5Y00DRAFT_228781 [Daldinia vernicosa]|uniref:uncharacterized protein n=1 Tax=Daldinia vernicosa TaxID=114800 RepID=UPI002008348D|nr:uncharacterized protein F5Y00DRAFT_228781 [Daldinia vernicosa]KAI0852154.1 hypothetical protein F5Y00DRAFT_228781 [Daldinia vernicosa]
MPRFGHVQDFWPQPSYWQNKNPRFLKGASSAVDIGPDGNLALMNKRTKRAEENSILVQPADPKKGNREIWAGYFNRTNGLDTMAKRYMDTHPPNTKTLALFMTQPNVGTDETSGGDYLGVKLLPFNDDLVVKGGLKRKADDVIACANCHKDTHTLADCVWPVHRKWGDIYGCPICNTKEHRFDHCHNQSSLDDWTRFEFLVLRRAGKCMIRSDCKVYHLTLQFLQEGRVNPETLVMPWTRSGAVALFNQPKAISTLEGWNYQNPRAQVIMDPNSAVGALRGLAATTGGDFVSFSAATRQAEKEKREQAKQYPTPAHPGAPPQAFVPQYQPAVSQPQPPAPQPRPAVSQPQPSRLPRKAPKAKGHHEPAQREQAELDVDMEDRQLNNELGI